MLRSTLSAVPRASRTATRNFATTVARRSHGPEGPYSNLPFRIHGRKYVPYWVIHTTFFVLGMGIPPIIIYYNLKKSGSL